MVDTFLIFSSQLYQAAAKLPKDTVFYVAEDPAVFRRPAVGKAILVLHRAAAQAFRERLLIRGHRVFYLEAAEYDSYEATVRHIAEKVSHLVAYAPSQPEQFLEAALTQGLTVKLQAAPAPVPVVAAGKGETTAKRLKARARHPHGIDRYIEEAVAYVERFFPTHPGDAHRLPYPATHADASDWLEAFLQERLSEAGSSVKSILRNPIIRELASIGLLTRDQFLTALQEVTLQVPKLPAGPVAALRAVVQGSKRG